MRRVQSDRLQRTQRHLRVDEDHRPAPRIDQRTRAERDAEGQGDRAGDGDAAAGWIAQHFRRRHDDRRSAEIYLRGKTKFQTPSSREAPNIKLQTSEWVTAFGI